MYHIVILEPDASIVDLYRKQIAVMGLSNHMAIEYARTAEETQRIGSSLLTSPEMGLACLVVDADAFHSHAVRKACELIGPFTSYKPGLLVFMTGFYGRGRDELAKVGVRGEVEKLSLVGEICKLLTVQVRM